MFRKVMVVKGDTLTIPGLKKFKGKKVEITLKELSVGSQAMNANTYFLCLLALIVELWYYCSW